MYMHEKHVMATHMLNSIDLYYTVHEMKAYEITFLLVCYVFNTHEHKEVNLASCDLPVYHNHIIICTSQPFCVMWCNSTLQVK